MALVEWQLRHWQNVTENMPKKVIRLSKMKQKAKLTANRAALASCPVPSVSVLLLAVKPRRVEFPWVFVSSDKRNRDLGSRATAAALPWKGASSCSWWKGLQLFSNYVFSAHYVTSSNRSHSSPWLHWKKCVSSLLNGSLNILQTYLINIYFPAWLKWKLPY